MVIHAPEGAPAEYDNRKLPSKRNYLKCVLAQVTLYAGGCKQFKSNGPQSYYAALLKDPTTEPGLAAAKYEEKLKQLTDGGVPPELEQIVPLPSQRRLVAPPDPDVDGGDAGAPPPPAIGDGKDWGSSADSRSSSSAAAPSDHDDDEAADGEDAADPYPAEIDGLLLKRERHLGRGDFGLRIACPNPAHPLCTCYRSAKMWTEDFGVEAPVLFLKTWMAKAFTTDQVRHKRWRPGKNDVRLFITSEASL